MHIFERLISWYVDHVTYLSIILLMAVESSFIPFPSEIVIPPAAWKAAAGELDVVLVVLSGISGSLLGALVNYGLSVSLGRSVIHAFSRTRVARVLLVDEAAVTRAERFFVKHGASATFIGRLVPAVRQLISIPAGLARMPLVTFLSFTLLGAGIWNVVLAALGYFLYSQREALDRYYHILVIAGVVLGVGFVAYLVVRGLTGQRKTADKEGP